MTFKAMQNDQFMNLLRGDGEYLLETSQYSPSAGLTDVSKILSRGIYKAFKQRDGIKKKFEDSLIEMLDQTNFDVYMVCVYILSQLFKEENGLSPFLLEKKCILDKLHIEMEKRKEEIIGGITYPSGYINTKAWQELERFKIVCREEYHIELF